MPAPQYADTFDKIIESADQIEINEKVQNSMKERKECTYCKTSIFNHSVA